MTNLKKKIKMKDLERTILCQHVVCACFKCNIFHQSTYTKKVLKYFHKSKAHTLNSLMFFHSLE